MIIPNFAAIARRYIPSVYFKNSEPLDEYISMGRFIAFDMDTERALEYIKKMTDTRPDVAAVIHQGKTQYDVDIGRSRAISNPSRVELLKHLSPLPNSDILIAQLKEVDNYQLLRYMAGEGEWPPHHWDVICPELAEVARRFHDMAVSSESNQGDKEMEQEVCIHYHSRLSSTSEELTGTITMSINGQLAIVDVRCKRGESVVQPQWVTVPKVGYDTAVHSLVRWFDNKAAAAVMITVYPDGGSPRTITVTLEA